MSSSTSSIDAGHVGRPHGLDGSFHVTRPQGDVLAQTTHVSVGGERREIVRRAGTDSRPILRLAGCEGREAAEALRGEPLLVERGDLLELGDDEWWPEDLQGCRVRDGEREVGVVATVMALPSCEALQVTREGGEELLVPLVRDAVRSVDVAAGVIDVNLAFVEGESG